MRKAIVLAASLLFLSLCFLACDDKNPSTSSPVIASEVWRLIEPGTKNYANLTLRKHENGTYSCAGDWFYLFFEDTVTCSFLSGIMTKNTDSIRIDCSGVGKYPPNSSGYVESSNFSMQMRGVFSSGACSGTWNIDFTKPEWQGWVEEGDFTGSLKSGNGVTDGY